MRLRRPCEHDRYDDHSVYVTGFPAVDCPGGEFLPEDAIVIEKVDGSWPVNALVWLSDLKGGRPNVRERLEPHFDALAAALAADQVGEPG